MIHTNKHPLPTCTFMLFCVLGLLAGCSTSPAHTVPGDFYNSVLSQVIFDNYYGVSLSVYQGDKGISRIDSAHRLGLVSDEDFAEVIDSLKRERKKIAPKCEITFNPSFGIYHDLSTMNEKDKKKIFAPLLSDTTFQRKFSSDAALTTLSAPCGLDASDFKIDFLQIEPRSSYRDTECGVISLSQPLLNAEGTQAILYCEHHFDIHDGTGIFVFAVRKKGTWRVYKYVRAWVSRFT